MLNLIIKQSEQQEFVLGGNFNKLDEINNN